MEDRRCIQRFSSLSRSLWLDVVSEGWCIKDRIDNYAYTIKERRFAPWAFVKVSGDCGVIFYFYVMIMALEAG